MEDIQKKFGCKRSGMCQFDLQGSCKALGVKNLPNHDKGHLNTLPTSATWGAVKKDQQRASILAEIETTQLQRPIDDILQNCNEELDEVSIVDDAIIDDSQLSVLLRIDLIPSISLSCCKHSAKNSAGNLLSLSLLSLLPLLPSALFCFFHLLCTEDGGKDSKTLCLCVCD